MMTKDTAELRKVAQEVLSSGVTYHRAKDIAVLLKEAKVMAMITIIKKIRG